MKMQETRKGPPLEPSEEGGTANTFILSFWPPVLWENKYLLFHWFVVLYYGGPKNPLKVQIR